jgi:L-methionine (R)-S-oxide reductase
MSEAANTTEAWLRQWLSTNGGVAGTVHVREADDLVLQAAVNIPPPVAAIVRLVPKGKGMAGLAFERDAPVSTCNLQTDTTGDVRPGAKAVNASAAVASHGGRRASAPTSRSRTSPGLITTLLVHAACARCREHGDPTCRWVGSFV